MLFEQVLNKGGIFSKDENIGEFKIDVGTVYAQPGHCFASRWAILFDPDDVANGTSGALKVTLSAIGKGDAIKPPSDPEGDDEVIEGYVWRTFSTEVIDTDLVIKCFE